MFGMKYERGAELRGALEGGGGGKGGRLLFCLLLPPSGGPHHLRSFENKTKHRKK